jgi:zeaxanthin glucosyltransferase
MYSTLGGHEIVFIGVPDAGPTVRAAGLNFVSYCEEEFPAGACASALAPVARIHGMEATRWTIGGAGRAFFRAASQHLPRVLAETGVEALVLDTIHMYLELVPISLGIPYAHLFRGKSWMADACLCLFGNPRERP